MTLVARLSGFTHIRMSLKTLVQSSSSALIESDGEVMLVRQAFDAYELAQVIGSEALIWRIKVV